MKSARDLERSVQVKQAVQNMDDWTRKVWTARQYGYSWREIAEQHGPKRKPGQTSISL